MGKCLGDNITNEQLKSIRNASFKGLSVGDYFEKDGKRFTIDHFNIPRKNENRHVVIGPESMTLK